MLILDDVKKATAASLRPLKPNGIFTDVKIPYKYQRKGTFVMLQRPRMVLGDDEALLEHLRLTQSLLGFAAIDRIKELKAENELLRAR